MFVDARFFVVLQILDSIVVSIPACHAGDPGSIPGRGVLFFFALSHTPFITPSTPFMHASFYYDSYSLYLNYSTSIEAQNDAHRSRISTCPRTTYLDLDYCNLSSSVYPVDSSRGCMLQTPTYQTPDTGVLFSFLFLVS